MLLNKLTLKIAGIITAGAALATAHPGHSTAVHLHFELILAGVLMGAICVVGLLKKRNDAIQ